MCQLHQKETQHNQLPQGEWKYFHHGLCDGVVKFMNMQHATFYFDNNFHYACKTHAPSITYHPIQLFIYYTMTMHLHGECGAKE